MDSAYFESMKPFVYDHIWYYREILNNPTGGSLHVVLDDGNTGHGSVHFCQIYAEDHDDTFGVFLARLLREFTEEKLSEMYQNGWVKNDLITVSHIERTCEASPSQWEGKTNDGQWVYVRYRWGSLTVSIGDTASNAVSGKVIFRKSMDDPLGGYLSYRELIKATEGVVSWPVSEDIDSNKADDEVKLGW